MDCNQAKEFATVRARCNCLLGVCSCDSASSSAAFEDEGAEAHVWIELFNIGAIHDGDQGVFPDDVF